MSDFEFIMDEIETMLEKHEVSEEYVVSFEWKKWRMEIYYDGDKFSVKPVKIQK